MGGHQIKHLQRQSVLDAVTILIFLCNNSRPVTATLPGATAGVGTEFRASFRARKQFWLLRICLQFSYEILNISGVGRPIAGLYGSTQHSQLAGHFSPGYRHLFIAVAPVLSPLCLILHLVTNKTPYQLLNTLRTKP